MRNSILDTPQVLNDGISFCTTCHNRLWQLKQTLASNLAALGSDMELVLIDYASTDGLSEWIWAHFENHIQDGRLIYFSLSHTVSWHVCKAKNLAHRLATRRYVFNRDADNFVTAEDLIHIRRAAAQEMPAHQWTDEWQDGSFGRIGLPRDLFMELGGYDEGLLPMAGQDIDLIRRIHGLDKRIWRLPAPHKPAIPNEKQDKIVATTSREVDPEKFFDAMSKANLDLSKFKILHQGAVRDGGFATFQGLLNGAPITIDGLGCVTRHEKAQR